MKGHIHTCKNCEKKFKAAHVRIHIGKKINVNMQQTIYSIYLKFMRGFTQKKNLMHVKNVTNNIVNQVI